MQWMQLDQNGDANSWSLGEFLAQDEVRVMMLDPACTKSLTFREFVNGPNTLSKSTAISNSDNWTGAPAAEDDVPRRHPFIDGRLHRRRPWAIQRGLRRPARDRGTETVAAAAHTLIYLP